MAKLKKELSVFGVFAIATGTTLSAGFFLLPGMAAGLAGPAVVLSYLFAGLLLIPPMLCIVELATAMPRSGGAYYFIDRSLGPIAGTIGGIGTWLALMLKTAFALVGMGAYLALFFPGDTPDWIYRVLAAGLAIAFGLINLLGSKKTGSAQVVLVVGLLAILGIFLVAGVPNISSDPFENFAPQGPASIISTTGVVFISFVGVTKVASVAEEIRDPEKNLPRGIFAALSTAILIYVVGIAVMVGVVGANRLAHDPGRNSGPDLTPVATAAYELMGNWGMYLISGAALLAFASVANAGILSASRYPLAMGRDHLLPSFFRRVSQRGVPLIGVLVTVSSIVLFVFVEPVKIAKLASAFQLLMFSLLSLAVIVMRESKLDSYDPGYRTPAYPWIPLIGCLGPSILILQMGWLPILLTVALIVLALVWYFKYAAIRVQRHGAIYHVFERLGRKRFDGLDRELRSILKEKGLREQDPFDEVVADAVVFDATEQDDFESLCTKASHALAMHSPTTAEELHRQFLEGTQVGATPVTKGIALPHLRVDGLHNPQLVIVRAKRGVVVDISAAPDRSGDRELVHALFFLLSSKQDPAQHLRMLAKLAESVDRPEFDGQWNQAESPQEVKEILLRNDRYLSLRLDPEGDGHMLIGLQLRETSLPPGCLVAMIRRDGDMLVPSGTTELEVADVLTVIGEPKSIQELRKQVFVNAQNETSAGQTQLSNQETP